MNDSLVCKRYELAQQVYAAHGVDTEQAMAAIDAIPISMHSWQGDDLLGFEGAESLTGGIQATGNYPGRARTADELRSDLDVALSCVPGTMKVSLHAVHAEKDGRKVDRDEYDVSLFERWIDWANARNIGLDFNPTFFSHPMSDGNFSVTSLDEKKRRFWIEHGKRCREIGEAFGKAQGQPCVINHWMPDGYKDTPADTNGPRARMVAALDEIFTATKNISEAHVLDGVESKLFGIGVESYTVGSNELMMGYALTRNKMLTLDTGHFHPTEQVSDKISAVLQFLPKILLHISRPVRWDSDHVVVWDTETARIFNEIVANHYEDRVFCALDYFDASINRVAAWVIGVRNAQKAILQAYLTPNDELRRLEANFDYTGRLAGQEEAKSRPFAPVWDMYCLKQGVPVGEAWLEEVRKYEREVLVKRG